MVKIKICGMRRTEDILYINKYLPDYTGFILSDGFKRSIDNETFYKLKRNLDSRIKTVGVFVNEPLENIEKNYYNKELDVIQLHGNEDEEYIKSLRQIFNGEVWKAVRAKSSADIEYADRLCCGKLLIDSFVPGKAGGTGKTANLNVINQANFSKPFFLAGGLNCENIIPAIKEIKPFGVDFSSSVETDGFKDEKKIREIVKKIRGFYNGKQ